MIDYIAIQHPDVILELATMHGFPTETEEEALMTLNFIKDVKWIHFPYIHILKVFPNTEIEELALANGVSKEDIMRSVNRAFHELPETLPFPKSFTRQYQANFLNEYFLNKERIKHVLPVQMKIVDREALIQKYDAYLPIEVKSIQDVLDFAEIDDFKLPEIEEKKEVPYIFNSKPSFEMKMSDPEAKRILLLDLSQYFSSQGMLYKVAEQPVGLMYLMTALKEEFKENIDGRIYKSGVDFDSFKELKNIIDEYQPDLIGIRTLSFFKEHFHQTVSLIRQWGVNVPIITGGQYATSEYQTILKDPNVDLVILGEGEYTFNELISKMLENDFNLPRVEILRSIKGIVYPQNEREDTCQVMLLDQFDNCLEKESIENLDIVTEPDQLAYVMYTSGTTGKPKGIMVEHRQVNNCIYWMQDEFKLDKNAVIVQRTNLTFDPSVWEIFWPLYLGARVKLLTTEQGKDAGFLIKLMEEKLTMMYCPASLVTGMTYLLSSISERSKLQLPWLLIGAEPISRETIKNFYSYYDGQIVNTYGPTECTINNTYCYLNRDDESQIVPIGKPVANNQIYILSKDLQLQPIKVSGEIYIAGNSLARGYINNPERTQQSFIPNPFGPGRLYKTGDTGCWLADGNIQIMGRVDDQVKIRGYRIELSEIESAFAKHPSIRESVVVVKDTTKSKADKRVCKLCGITTAYPDVRINNDGVCNICDNFSEYKQLTNQYFKTLNDLDQLIKTKNQSDSGKYDCLLLYAGGRAAGYALYQLVKKGYRVLTVTYDNGYFAKSDMENIKKVTARLGVDHVTMTHPKTEEILRASLKSVDTVCTGCFLTSSSLAVDYAKKEGIPIVIGATLSRGQIIENKLYGLFKQGITDITQLEEELANLQKMTYAMTEEISKYIEIDSVKDGSIYNEVKVIDFYRYCNITNEEMILYLNNQDPYWQKRKNYAIYSTNCPIKQIGDLCHLKERDYHYYGSATSWEKRLSHIILQNVHEDLQNNVTEKALENFMRKIDYQKEKVTLNIETKYLCGYFVADDELELSDLREYLSDELPGYMVPSYIMQIDSLPLTSNGKVDKKALPEPEGNISAAEYVAPTNIVETELANIWSEVLGAKQVGINDNFFELGGDSIKAIQILAKSNQSGINITVKDIFEYRTISKLLENVDYDKEKEIASQDEVTGKVVLTPIQRWFFEQVFEKKLIQPHYWNQRELFTLSKDVDLQLLENVFCMLIEHHDALRMNFENEDDTIIQINRRVDEVDFKLEYVDLSSDSEVIQKSKLIQISEEIQSSIDLENDLLFKAVVFDLGKAGKRLFISNHHLVIDSVSWRILLEDIENLYKSNLEDSLPLKTTSFKEWSQRLASYAKTEDVDYEYWEKIDTNRLKSITNSPVSDNFWSDHEKIVFELGEKQTEQLLTQVNYAYNTEINDLLLSALTMAVSKVIEQDQFIVNLEGHGREEIIEGVDLSRTVGWFTSAYPVYLERQENIETTIKQVKESLRKIPNKGLNYGIGRYLAEVEQLKEFNLDISFNYLGQFSDAFGRNQDKERLLSGCTELAGRSLHVQNQHPFLIDINGMVIDGKLELTVSYNTKYFDSGLIKDLAESYQQSLREIIEHCINQSETSYTVSDFQAELIDQDDFDLIAQLYSE